MRAILIRHCKTDFNASGRIMGWSDSPRVENWLEDMHYIEDVLRQKGAQPDLVYCSKLGRSQHTGEYFATQLGAEGPVSCLQFNEVNYGSLAEKPKKWVSANYPQHKQDPDFVYPNGESFRQMQQRSVELLTELSVKHPSNCLLIVAHAGVIRGLLSHFMKLEYTEQLKRRVSHRFIGVMDLAEGNCGNYEEWGEPSEFITEQVLPCPSSCA